MSNPLRGEASIVVDGEARVLRPTFTALVAAEDELGPLFALVERAGEGQLTAGRAGGLVLALPGRARAITRDAVGEAVMEQGLAASARPLRTLLGAILQGAGERALRRLRCLPVLDRRARARLAAGRVLGGNPGRTGCLSRRPCPNLGAPAHRWRAAISNE